MSVQILQYNIGSDHHVRAVVTQEAMNVPSDLVLTVTGPDQTFGREVVRFMGERLNAHLQSLHPDRQVEVTEVGSSNAVPDEMVVQARYRIIDRALAANQNSADAPQFPAVPLENTAAHVMAGLAMVGEKYRDAMEALTLVKQQYANLPTLATNQNWQTKIAAGIASTFQSK